MASKNRKIRRTGEPSSLRVEECYYNEAIPNRTEPRNAKYTQKCGGKTENGTDFRKNRGILMT